LKAPEAWIGAAIIFSAQGSKGIISCAGFPGKKNMEYNDVYPKGILPTSYWLYSTKELTETSS